MDHFDKSNEQSKLGYEKKDLYVVGGGAGHFSPRDRAY